MYANVKSAVKHNNQISNNIDITVGLIQGDSNSFLLFIMFVQFVNDILQHVNSNLESIFTIDELRLFADDQALFATSPESLQLMLNDLETFCNQSYLRINVEKTKVMIFEKSRRTTFHDFYICDEKIEVVSSFKYLGLNFFENGKWLNTQKKIADNANSAMYNLFSIFSRYVFNPSDKCKLFDSLVLPVLSYASDI